MTSSTCDANGIRVLKFSQPHGPIYHYEEATNITFGDQPNLKDPLDKKSKFRLSFRPKKKKKESASDEIDNADDKAQKEKKKKKKKGSSKWETDEDRVRSNHCEFKVKYLECGKDEWEVLLEISVSNMSTKLKG